MTANTSKTRKEKDHKFKVSLASDLSRVLDIDPDDIVVPSSSFPGLDLRLSPKALQKFPFGMECKRQETFSIPAWWKQCAGNSAAANLTPLLVVRRNHEDALAVLRWADLLALVGRQCEMVSDCPVLRGEDARRFHEALQRPPEITEAARQLIRDASRLASDGDHRWQNLADGLTGGRP